MIHLEMRDLGVNGMLRDGNSRFESLRIEFVNGGVNSFGGGQDRVG